MKKGSYQWFVFDTVYCSVGIYSKDSVTRHSFVLLYINDICETLILLNLFYADDTSLECSTASITEGSS